MAFPANCPKSFQNPFLGQIRPFSTSLLIPRQKFQGPFSGHCQSGDMDHHPHPAGPVPRVHGGGSTMLSDIKRKGLRLGKRVLSFHGCNRQPSDPSHLTQRDMGLRWIGAAELLDGFRFLRGSHILATRLIFPQQAQLVIERLRISNPQTLYGQRCPSFCAWTQIPLRE